MGRLRPGIIMVEKNLQVVLLMIVRMGRLLNGMKMGRNIESKIIVMGKKMVYCLPGTRVDRRKSKNIIRAG